MAAPSRDAVTAHALIPEALTLGPAQGRKTKGHGSPLNHTYGARGPRRRHGRAETAVPLSPATLRPKVVEHPPPAGVRTNERGVTVNGGASLISANATAAANTAVTQVFIIPGQVPPAPWTSPPHCQHWASENPFSWMTVIREDGSAVRNLEFVRCHRAGGLGQSRTPLSPSGQRHAVISGTKPRTPVRDHHSELGPEAAAGPVQTDGQHERPDLGQADSTASSNPPGLTGPRGAAASAHVFHQAFSREVTDFRRPCLI